LRERGDAAGLLASPISFQTRVSKAPAASNNIASWSRAIPQSIQIVSLYVSL
jgi:hypothetical protein